MLCQQRPELGAIEKNTTKVISQLEKAALLGADLVVLPELFLSGYPLEDLIFRPEMAEKISIACDLIAQKCQKISLILGSPFYEKEKTYNSALFFSQGKLQKAHHKKNLPNYSVFDEHRYFAEGRSETIVELSGFRIMLSVCEEMWLESMPNCIKKSQVDVVLSINGSPFYLGKQEEREALVKQISKETNTAVGYINLSSCQDELVFDGGSFVVDARGKTVAKARQFTTDTIIFDLEKKQEAVSLHGNKKAELFYTKEQQLFLALTTSLRSYVDNNGFKGVILGLSGGIDSAVVLVLACAALGAKRVKAVMMPYEYTSSISVEDARQLAKNCDVDYQEIPIESIVDSTQEILPCDRSTEKWQLTKQNIQARSRGLILMALSNYSDYMVLATGNKSEMAVGYSTLYGDMVGGFAPLKDVDKTSVYSLARYCNEAFERIPERIITREPSAELLPEQKDSDNLPEYSELDPILKGYIEQGCSYKELLSLSTENKVAKVLSMVDRNEYKRKQAAMGTKVTKLALGKDRRMPVTQSWKHGHE